MTLIDQILRLAELWATEKGHSTTARLSTIVANDGGLLKRLGDGGNTTVQTLDKFIIFFRSADKWPEGAIPAEAQALIADVGHITSLPDNDPSRTLDRRIQAARNAA